jgi:hypothetical protein
MDAYDIGTWPDDMRPVWFGMVVARATCPQGCKTPHQAQIWEEEVKGMILNDPYAVRLSFKRGGMCFCFMTCISD